jgi:AcrR family transcriptional regulator
VREVARRLGVSHNHIPQRFGSKERLWHAAVDHGFELLLKDLLQVFENPPPDDLSRLRAMVVRFVEANAARPALLRIINHEAGVGGPRLNYLFDRFIEPVRQLGEKMLAQLHAQGQVRTKWVGLVYFLMTNGAGGPVTFPGLAERLGTAVDRHDPAAVRQYAERIVDLLFEGIGPG